MNDILDGLKRSPAILAGLVEGISAARLRERRGEGFWTIQEHLAHLAEVQPMLTGRFRRILTEDCPEFVPFIPDPDAPKAEKKLPEPAEALAAFAAERKVQVELLSGLSAEAWTRSARHPEYDLYDLRILARHALLHDGWHMYRMEELWLTRPEHLSPKPL